MSDRVFSELLYGEGAHADPTACIEDLRADAAGRTIDGFPHSIWPLVSHTDYWIDYEIKRIADEAPPYPQHAALSWPVEVAPASEKHWSETKLNFSVLLRRLAILRSRRGRVRRVRSRQHIPDMQKSLLRYSLCCWQTLVHNSYHAGQIAMMRRCLCAWPPRAGGDSW
jgi:hypothetical protein